MYVIHEQYVNIFNDNFKLSKKQSFYDKIGTLTFVTIKSSDR